MTRLALLVVLLTPSVVLADDDFSSDRPGFANATSAAPTGRPITEFGAAIAWDEVDPTVATLPNLRIRVGASPWLELRVDAPTMRLADPVGLGDLTLGVKLASPVAGSLAISLIPSVRLPLGTGGGVATGRLELNWSASVGRLGFGGNLAAGVLTVEGQRRAHGEGSVAVSVAATEALTLYAQSFVRWTRGRRPRPYAGAGAYLRVHPRVQVDLSADVGLTDAATRFVAQLGATVLWGRGPAGDAGEPPLRDTAGVSDRAAPDPASTARAASRERGSAGAASGR